MRVLQVHTRYRLAGGEDAVAGAEVGLLREAGHEVRTLVLHNPEGVASTAATLARAPWNAQAARQVVDAAVNQGPRPDVVHVHNTWFALSPAVLPALQAAGCSVVLTQQNYRLTCVSANLMRDGAACHDCLGRSPLPGVRHRCYRGSAIASSAVAATISLARRRRAYDSVDAFIAPSMRTRDLLVQAGLPAERLHVVPNVVARRVPRVSPPSWSRTVLFAGRLVPEKGLDVLLTAWAQVAPHGLTLEVAGEGQLAAQAANTPGTILLGRLSTEQVAERMRAARAVLVPSMWDEPFGLVAAEAYAVGTPVLAGRHGALPELLAAADNQRWLVDDDGWATAIEQLDDDDDVDSAGRRGLTAYEQHWTPERGLERLLAVYRAATREG